MPLETAINGSRVKHVSVDGGQAMYLAHNGGVIYHERVNFNVSAYSNGSVSGQASAPIPMGATVSVAAVPDSGYRFLHWERKMGEFSRVPIDAPAQYTFEMDPTWREPCNELRARFELITYHVNVVVYNGVGGSASTQTALAGPGETVTLTATPLPGYAFSSWSSYPSVAITNSQFIMPASDITITARFSAIQYTTSVSLSIPAAGGTSATPNPATIGTTVTVGISLTTGYDFSNWTVLSGGVSLTNANTTRPTFVMPANNVSVRANVIKISDIISFKAFNNHGVEMASYRVYIDSTWYSNPINNFHIFSGGSGTWNITLNVDAVATGPNGVTGNFLQWIMPSGVSFLSGNASTRNVQVAVAYGHGDRTIIAQYSGCWS